MKCLIDKCRTQTFQPLIKGIWETHGKNLQIEMLYKNHEILLFPNKDLINPPYCHFNNTEMAVTFPHHILVYMLCELVKTAGKLSKDYPSVVNV